MTMPVVDQGPGGRMKRSWLIGKMVGVAHADPGCSYQQVCRAPGDGPKERWIGSLRLGWAIGLILLPLAVAPSADLAPLGNVLHVSPKGTAAGDGSAERPLDLATALSARGPAKPGETILLEGGTYEGEIRGIERVPFLMEVSGEPEKPVRVMPSPGASVHLNGTLSITGSWVSVVGLEIGDLGWDLEEKVRKNKASVEVSSSEHVQLINCNLFGGWCGVYSLAGGTDIELYGLLVHDFGSWGHGYAGGSSFYVQNRKGSSKSISDCVGWRSGALNMAPHGQKGVVTGFELARNILFLPGGVTPTSQRWDNLYVSTATPIEQMNVTSNVLYYSGAGKPIRSNARLSNLKTPALNRGAIFQDNWVMGAPTGLRLGRWEGFRASGNTIWAERVLVEVSSAPTGDGIPPQADKPDLSGYSFTGNTYYLPENGKGFLHSNREHVSTNEDARITFADWQALGMDKDSKVLPVKNGKPTGTKTLVFPNKYQAGRAHVAVFNWDGLAEVEVDLAGAVPAGARIAVYNLLDVRQTLGLAKPVFSGALDGTKGRLPMRRDSASPDFEAFLIMPLPAVP